ncbi:MAG: TonB family protein [Candidatus Omnitrophota bacterium]|nr:TonB family protein [Candidatus Omnitrophota bacterium]
MPLFKDRNLNIAILISIAWHFVFMFSVKPVFPSGRIAGHSTSISFLGDILESITPESEKPFVSRRIMLDNRAEGFKEDGPGFMNIRTDKREFAYSLDDDRTLGNPNASRKKEPVRVKFSDFFIKGEAKDRIIVYKPDLDKPVMMPSDFNSDLSLDVKFKISREGFVKYAECATSSGFPEIDQLAVRHVRKWFFVPSIKDDQEGTARISFKQ